MSVTIRVYSFLLFINVTDFVFVLKYVPCKSTGGAVVVSVCSAM